MHLIIFLMECNGSDVEYIVGEEEDDMYIPTVLT